jgi:hypothetical protein
MVTSTSHHSGIVLENSVRGYHEAECDMLPRVSKLSAVADHNLLMIEQRDKVVVFLPPLRPDLNLFNFFLWEVPERDVTNEISQCYEMRPMIIQLCSNTDIDVCWGPSHQEVVGLS